MSKLTPLQRRKKVSLGHRRVSTHISFLGHVPLFTGPLTLPSMSLPSCRHCFKVSQVSWTVGVTFSHFIFLRKDLKLVNLPLVRKKSLMSLVLVLEWMSLG